MALNRNIVLRTVALLTLWLAATGCIKESGDCPTDQLPKNSFSLFIRAYANEVDEVTEKDQVSDVLLYVFDSRGLFTHTISTKVGSTVILDSPINESLTIVAWANGGGASNDNFPKLEEGISNILDYTVGLNGLTRSESSLFDSPSDLFYGNIKLTSVDNNQRRELAVKRVVGSMNITIRNLDRILAPDQGPVSVVVGNTHPGLGFDGNLIGGKTASYRPMVENRSLGLYSTGIFNMLPANDGITIYIYQGDNLVASIDKVGGEPIKVAVGVTTNVLIDFQTSMTVRMSITEWNKAYLWKEFN